MKCIWSKHFHFKQAWWRGQIKAFHKSKPGGQVLPPSKAIFENMCSISLGMSLINLDMWELT